MDKILPSRKQVMKIEHILKKSWNSHGISLLTAHNESRTRRSDNSIYRPTAVIWLWAFGLCSRFQIVMTGRRQTILSTLYFQFEKTFHFLFVYVMNTCDGLLCLPSWHHGKQCKLPWKIHGILLSDLCGNPDLC